MVLKQPPKRRTGEAFPADFLGRIIATNPGKIVPIISNSFRINQIFSTEDRLPDFFADTSKQDEKSLSIEQQLTQVWAKDIRYPMADPHDLARVTQYFQTENGDAEIAKKEYINFLKSYLLDLSSEEEYRETVENLMPEMRSLPFSEIARQLKYPRFPPAIEDPLSLLAKLPFPIYITTSYFDFLERALIKVGNKTPHTQVIHWNDSHYPEEQEDIPDPSVGEPVVYHLFGMENDASSLVISEDDYLKFLVTTVSDTSKLNPVVPLKLQGTLASSHLLLLGYQLKEWDFRILFRFILNYRTAQSGKSGIFIQVKPKRGDPHLVGYLSQYFDKQDFKIEWKTPERFIQDLWQAWNGRER